MAEDLHPYALLGARLAAVEPHDAYLLLDARKRYTPHSDAKVRRAVESLVDEGYFALAEDGRERWSSSGLLPTQKMLDEAARLDVSAVYGPGEYSLDTGAQKAHANLWSLLLFQGGIEEYYGVTQGPQYIDTRLAHLLVCGLDQKASTMPDLDTWSEFQGTFAESDHHASGLRAHAACNCGQYKVDDEWNPDLTVVYKLDSRGCLAKLMSYEFHGLSYYYSALTREQKKNPDAKRPYENYVPLAA